jgi:peptide/nickel transport system substrate-binding protein
VSLEDRRAILLALGCCVLVAAACSAPTAIENPFAQGAADTPTVHVVPPTPVPPSLLVVCLAEEPNTLYLYGRPNHSAQTILPALYDGPIDVLGYQFRPVILEEIPSVEAGSARLEPVTLSSGDLYFNPESRLPESLRSGKPYLPSGCALLDCVRSFEGGQVQVDRLVVDFRLLEGLTWSDGEPLTAQDSVYSFDLDAHPETDTLKDQVHRTAAYDAIDDRTVRWTGIPGFLDPELPANFWTPLPEHILADIAPADLADAEPASRAPIGWGPYILERWDAGRSMEFVPNPNYHRQEEGLPSFERVLVRFVEEHDAAALQQVLTGECDILEETLVGADFLDRAKLLSAQGRLQTASAAGALMERLDFNTAPPDGRPRLLADAAMRRALASCIDRQALIAGPLAGLGSVPTGYLPAGHPLADLRRWPGLRRWR